MKYTMLLSSIFAIVFCCISTTSSSPSAQSVNGSHAETRAGPLCMACKSGCPKYVNVSMSPFCRTSSESAEWRLHTPLCKLARISEVKEVIVIPNLNLDNEVAATVTNLESGNEAGIQSTIERTKLGPFLIISAASLSLTTLQATQPMAVAIDNIVQKIDTLAASANGLAPLLDIASIYLQYIPDREAIQYQTEKLQLFLKSTPEYASANLDEFMSAYAASGKDLPLHNMYAEANIIISQVSDVTGCFRRVVADFGNDIIMHVNAGVACNYVYNLFAGLDYGSILGTWSKNLNTLESIVQAAEDKCMGISSQDDLSNYMYNIRDVGGCPYGNHEQRCKSTSIAMTDKFDWMAWSFTCYDSPHGAHAYDEDEISGPQYARSGWDESQLRGIYMTKYQRDSTDPNLVWNCMNGRKNLNCDEVHSILRGCGVGGSLACAEVQLNVYNYRDGDRGFHEYIGGNDVDVWVTWIDTEPIPPPPGAANILPMQNH